MLYSQAPGPDHPEPNAWHVPSLIKTLQSREVSLNKCQTVG